MRIPIIVAATTAASIAFTGSSAKPKGDQKPNVMIILLDDVGFGHLSAFGGPYRTPNIERLSKGQSPHSIVLSCSDSRLPPEAIFDQKLGEIFTVRSAGEALSAPAIASIEYAVAHLGSKLIVVLGHTNCGAVKAAVETIEGSSAGSQNLDQLVSDIHPRIRATLKSKKLEKDLRSASWANAKGVAKDLLTRSKLLTNAVQSGGVKIQVGLYDLATGHVDFEQ